MKFSPDKIILGCTHYPYLADTMVKILNQDIFIDPAEIFVRFIKSELEKLNLINDNTQNSKNMFFVSANPELFMLNAEFFYKIDNPPKLIEF